MRFCSPRFVAAVGIFVFGLCLPAASEEVCPIDLETGLPFTTSIADYLSRPEFESIKQDAASGDPAALYDLAELHLSGHAGICENEETAEGLMLRSAEAGYAPAQEQLGRRLSSRDEAAAERWLMKSAEQGRVSSMLRLGNMMAARAGESETSPWHARAFEWYSKAAAAGDAEGQLEAASHYLNGLGVVQDFEAGVALMRRSANGDQPLSRYVMCVATESMPGTKALIEDTEAYMWCIIAGAEGFFDVTDRRNELLAELTPQQVLESQRRAREWKPRSIN